jgi:poly(3-hydroxybutyrate) depolymerase
LRIAKTLSESILTYVCCGLVPLYACSAEAIAEQLKAGSGSFIFKKQNDNKEIRVWYYRPTLLTEGSKIVFVMHGVKRNGEKYRDEWIPYAKRGSFLLLVPEFSKKDYPRSAGYNLGNMFSPSGAKNDKSLWSFTIIEDIFDYIKTITQSEAEAYSIYGHSAGAQFVHRLVMFNPNARIQTAIAANAGWYTMPTDAVAFPYGLKNSGRDARNVAMSFGKDLVILLGDKDTDENHKYLRKTAAAMKQGKHRFARGHGFYKMAKSSAKEEKVEFKWRLHVVHGVGHSNSGMSLHAAKLLW